MVVNCSSKERLLDLSSNLLINKLCNVSHEAIEFTTKLLNQINGFHLKEVANNIKATSSCWTWCNPQRVAISLICSTIETWFSLVKYGTLFNFVGGISWWTTICKGLPTWKAMSGKFWAIWWIRGTCCCTVNGNKGWVGWFTFCWYIFKLLIAAVVPLIDAKKKIDLLVFLQKWALQIQNDHEHLDLQENQYLQWLS